MATGDDIWISLVQSMQRLSLLCCVSNTSPFCCFLFHHLFSPWQHFLQALINPQLMCWSVLFPPTLSLRPPLSNTLKLLAILEIYCHCFITNRYLSRASCRSLSTDLILQSFSKHQFLQPWRSQLLRRHPEKARVKVGSSHSSTATVEGRITPVTLHHCCWLAVLKSLFKKRVLPHHLGEGAKMQSSSRAVISLKEIQLF